MSTTRPQRALTLSMLLLILMALVSLHEPAAAAASTPPPDADLYTSYFFGTGYQNVTWVVCGSTQQTEGCYDSGDLGPFGQVGAMIESNPAIDLTTNTVTRLVYVVDIASGSGGNGVELYVYKKTDVVSSTFDTTTVTLDGAPRRQ